MMTMEDITHKLNKLKEEHAILDEEITRILTQPLYDQLALQRLKKKKLQIKDDMIKLRNKILPDIIA
jgi:hypothetical protein